MKTRMILMVLGLLLTAPVGTVVEAATNVERVTGKVTELAQSKRWREALEITRMGFRGCAPGPQGNGCRVVLQYTEGYLLQRVAEEIKEPPMKARKLREAVRQYELVRRQEPSHGPTLLNLALAYRELGNGRKYEEVLQAGAALHTRDAARFNILLAEAREAKQPPDLKGALAAYSRAVRADPEATTLRFRIVALHRSLPSDHLGNFLKLLGEWEEEYPDAAAEGYEVVMLRGKRDHPDTAADAFVHWVGLLGRRDALSLKEATQMVQGLGSRVGLTGSSTQTLDDAYQQLLEYLENAETGSWDLSWWLRSQERQETLSSLALALGRGWLASGSPASTAACWEGARGLATWGSRAWLELRTNLATLYTSYPELEEGAFERFESELFQSKGEAYRTEDLEAIQSFHTVLGIIYAERGEWISDHPYRNAMFQLSSAIHAAEKRQDVPYQPQARIKKLRAQGLATILESDELKRQFLAYPNRYLATQDPNPSPEVLERETEKAFLTAAEGYLDQDDLGSATEMLGRAIKVGGSTQGREQARYLRKVVDLRSGLEASKDDTGAGPGRKHPCATKKLDGLLSGKPPEGLSQSFVNRQQFKVLSDCVISGQSKDRELDAARALTLAVDKKITLIGGADVRRVTDLQNRLSETGDVQRENRHLQKIDMSEAPSLRVSDSPRSAIKMIRVDRGVALAAKEVKDQGPGKRKPFIIRNEKVIYKKGRK